MLNGYKSCRYRHYCKGFFRRCGRNALLHEYDKFIIGRMGVPYRAKGMNIISIAIDAPQDDINKLAGAIGRIEGVTAKTVNAPE